MYPIGILKQIINIIERRLYYMSTFNNVNILNELTIGGGGIIESGTNENGWYLKFYNGIIIGGNTYIRTDITIENEYGNIYQSLFRVNLPVPLRSTSDLLSAWCSRAQYSTSASWASYAGTSEADGLLFRIYDLYQRTNTANTTISYGYIGWYK